MVYELWSETFPVEALQEHLKRHVFSLDPIYQSKAFGGWSVLSSNGSYQDGWHMGHQLYVPGLNQEDVLKNLKASGMKPGSEYVLPTEICQGPMLEVIDKIRSFGLDPRRARVIQLTPGLSSSWHRDAPDHLYAVRLHIPIFTNEGCFFETETERAHLPADGHGYFLYVNRVHRVVNHGTTYRYHLVVDVIDHRGITQFHRYADFVARRNNSAPQSV